MENFYLKTFFLFLNKKFFFFFYDFKDDFSIIKTIIEKLNFIDDFKEI